MKIGIDANPIVGRRAGVGWHTYHHVKALVELKEAGVEYLYYANGPIPCDLLNLATGRPGDGGSGVALGLG
ncbi:MAG: hypothetical protein ACREI3_04160 [Nitrospirales bacterium]